MESIAATEHSYSLKTTLLSNAVASDLQTLVDGVQGSSRDARQSFV